MLDLNILPLPQLFDVLTGDGSLPRLLEAARREDLGDVGDVTTAAMIDAGRSVEAAVVIREAGIACGGPLVGPVLDAFDCGAEVHLLAEDGGACTPGDVLVRLSGDLGPILGVERTLLNLVGRLCGVATITARYVERVAGTGAVICDTRKTTPGLRALEKYAVRCGGGTLHRVGLHDAVLVKDNHLAHLDPGKPGDLAVAVEQASRAARSVHDLRFVEVEVDTLEQLDALLGCPPGTIDIVLLDNMTPDELREAVTRRDQAGVDVRLEASGGINLDSVRSVADSGVDRISVGALTHAARALDVGLDVD